jgi:hypothetical protein
MDIHNPMEKSLTLGSASDPYCAQFLSHTRKWIIVTPLLSIVDLSLVVVRELLLFRLPAGLIPPTFKEKQEFL